MVNQQAGSTWQATRAWSIGYDVGKRFDYSAVCIARVIERPSPLDGKLETVYIVETLERLALGVNYLDQAQVLCAMMAGLRERAIAESEHAAAHGFNAPAQIPARRLFVDETGVGDSFCDAVERLLRVDRSTSDVELIPTRFVAGEAYRRQFERGRMRGLVGKAYLARRLVTMVKSQRVMLPAALAGRMDVEEELRAYEARMREDDGHTTYGAQAPGTHDDLLTSLALVVLEGWNDYGATTIAYTW